MKQKAFLTILISVIIGIFIGFFIWGQVHRIRTRDIKSFSSENSFKDRTYSIIEPTPEQEREIEPIIEKYALKIDSLRSESSQKFKDLINSYHNELEPYVTEKQMQSLIEFPKHFKKNRKDSSCEGKKKENQ